MPTDEEKKEIRSQRHDFIKEYYKMATMDLDRHLKAGWQTIAVLAGGAAILTAGHDDKIGLPVATTIALITALWGALTIIDANYWSLRAIAFLANVEAVYFSKEDRKYFNPYIGSHPPFKLLDSLRYMLWLCLMFGLTVVLDAAWELNTKAPTIAAFKKFYTDMSALSFILWSVPVLVLTWSVQWLFLTWSKRLKDYLEFSQDSPGPGLRQKVDKIRSVMLETSTDVTVENDIQAALIAHLRQRRRPWKIVTALHSVVAISVTLAILYFLAVKLRG